MDVPKKNKELKDSELIKEITSKLYNFIIVEESNWIFDICNTCFNRKFKTLDAYGEWIKENHIFTAPYITNDLKIFYLRKDKAKFLVYGWIEFGVKENQQLYSFNCVREKPLVYSKKEIEKIIKL